MKGVESTLKILIHLLQVMANSWRILGKKKRLIFISQNVTGDDWVVGCSQHDSWSWRATLQGAVAGGGHFPFPPQLCVECSLYVGFSLCFQQTVCSVKKLELLMQTKLIHLPKREGCSPGPISLPGLQKNNLPWCCLSFQDQLSSTMTKFCALKKNQQNWEISPWRCPGPSL